MRLRSRRARLKPGGRVIVREAPSPPTTGMPTLLERVLGYLDEEESELAIAPKVLEAAMAEIGRGERTVAEITVALALTPEDVTGLQTVFSQIHENPVTLTIQEFRDLMALGSVRNRATTTGAYYTLIEVASRLGL